MNNYISNQILSTITLLIIGLLIFLLPNKWIDKEKWGCFGTIIILCCIYSFYRVIVLSYFSVEVIGTTKGISTGLKSTKSIKYTFEYRGKIYNGENDYNKSAVVNGGRYIVHVSDAIFITNWMDFSRPVE
jgi:hypothetical protein